jgi:hypothetical protein
LAVNDALCPDLEPQAGQAVLGCRGRKDVDTGRIALRCDRRDIGQAYIGGIGNLRLRQYLPAGQQYMYADPIVVAVRNHIAVGPDSHDIQSRNPAKTTITIIQ